MKKEDKLIQVLAAKTSKFFKELLKFQKHYKETGELYLDGAEFFGKEDSQEQQQKKEQQKSKTKISHEKIKPKISAREIITSGKKQLGIPKKPPTAYLTFFKENREAYAKAHQELTPNQVAQMLGKQWREMNEKNKDIYQKKYEIQNQRYMEEMQDYEKQNGIIRKKKIEKSKSHKKILEDADESELLQNQIQEIQKRLTAQKKGQDNQSEESENDIIIAQNNNE